MSWERRQLAWATGDLCTPGWRTASVPQGGREEDILSAVSWGESLKTGGWQASRVRQPPVRPHVAPVMVLCLPAQPETPRAEATLGLEGGAVRGARREQEALYGAEK